MARIRQQLPPQIRKIEVRDRRTRKTVVRYEVRADAGINPATGERQQTKRRFATEREARDKLAEITDAAVQGTFVPRRSITVAEWCEDYLKGRHSLRPTSRSKLGYDLKPLVERHGDLPLQRLTKADIDELVADLLRGGTTTAKQRKRRPWKPITVNKFTQTVAMVLAAAKREGVVNRNVAEHVDPVAVPHKPVDTYTGAEVDRLLASVADDRIVHAWELSLAGLRRGEIAGLRWVDVDLDAGTLAIVNNRVDAGGQAVEGDPKSLASRRTLPLPPHLVAVLRAARARQAAEKLYLGGDGGPFDYVVSNTDGMPYHPQVLSRMWAAVVKAAGLRHLKLQGARHTAATHMHLKGVPIAVVAEWIGHRDASLTLRVYAHSQNEALKAAGDTFNRVVSPSCH